MIEHDLYNIGRNNKLLRNPIESMPNRVAAVRDAQGYRTKCWIFNCITYIYNTL